ncbi:hypothetical protein ACWEOE_10755 [Amycolatopsis sp. NPDC004368]
MIASIAARRQAAGLVGLAADGKLEQHRRGLVAQVQNNPVRAVELLTVLAETIAELAPDTAAIGAERLVPGVPPLIAELRRAHAAYAGGSRSPWAVKGEREYQRLKKARQRARQKTSAATEVGAA